MSWSSMPQHTASVSCACGAKGTFSSSMGSVITQRVREFYDHHRACLRPVEDDQRGDEASHAS